jgi:hypothetical protein
MVVSLRQSHTVTFHRFYWPYWHLYGDGNEIPTRPDSIGRATAMLPAGQYAATWELERTPLERDGLWISGITAAGIFLFFAASYGKKRIRKRSVK